MSGSRSPARVPAFPRSRSRPRLQERIACRPGGSHPRLSAPPVRHCTLCAGGRMPPGTVLRQAPLGRAVYRSFARGPGAGTAWPTRHPAAAAPRRAEPAPQPSRHARLRGRAPSPTGWGGGEWVGRVSPQPGGGDRVASAPFRVPRALGLGAAREGELGGVHVSLVHRSAQLSVELCANVG